MPKNEASADDDTDDAIDLLTQDHAEVKELFEQYEELVEEGADDEDKQVLAEQICALLTVHATIEEEIFYPAARAVLGEDEDLVDEAEVEHSTAKDLIAQIQASSPEEALYDAKVKVLAEYIEHHVREEEDEMFPKCLKAGLDTESLGAELTARKDDLMDEMDAEAEADAEADEERR